MVIIDGSEYKSIAIFSDVHLPFQADFPLNEACDIIKERKPDCIIVDGDLMDCFDISKFNRQPKFGVRLKDEIALAQAFLSDLRMENPASRIIYIEGNHEFRLKTYLVRTAPEIYDLYSFPEMLKLQELKIEWVPVRNGATKFVDNYVVLDEIYIGHFDKVNQGSGMTARNLLQKKGRSVVQGHIHRAAQIWERAIDGEIIMGVENPCLCRLDPFYGSENNWQNGMTFLNKNKRGHWMPETIIL